MLGSMPPSSFDGLKALLRLIIRLPWILLVLACSAMTAWLLLCLAWRAFRWVYWSWLAHDWTF